MAGYLYIHIVSEEPVAIKKDGDNQDTHWLENIQGIQENVSVGSIKFPLQKSTHRIIQCIPGTQEQIRPLPNLWYVVKNFQVKNFSTKLINGKEKPAGPPNSPPVKRIKSSCMINIQLH